MACGILGQNWLEHCDRLRRPHPFVLPRHFCESTPFNGTCIAWRPLFDHSTDSTSSSELRWLARSCRSVRIHELEVHSTALKPAEKTRSESLAMDRKNKYRCRRRVKPPKVIAEGYRAARSRWTCSPVKSRLSPVPRGASGYSRTLIRHLRMSADT
jgi:hypothetical protein